MGKRNILIIASIVAVLVLVVVITALLNTGNIAEKKELEKQAVIQVISGDEVLGEIDMELIENLRPVVFNANLDTSDSGPETHQYRGIALNKVLEALDIDMNGYSTAIAKAIDGYNVAYGADEVMDDNNIYIAIERDGEPLGSKSTGGSGPYQIIVTKDQFSQRWCKFVVELELVK